MQRRKCRYDKMWVLLWLQMEEMFTTNPASNKIIESLSDKIRLDTAVAIVIENFNIFTDEIAQAAMVD
ncbi:hypothetical protein PIB30_092973 [Stylosanthes scabra]|uniref:Uncharacterized protein n=1 Tax=Stylosanthes scabra TaxID=79078 RepID=A0ABU6RVX2_9FABA|nr:hypothetical protein [Stylosanthes scabra]